MKGITTWDERTDVAVVGSGAAGLSAAIEARQAGVSVIVFEKMKAVPQVVIPTGTACRERPRTKQSGGKESLARP
jgi:succinate dehydrogenase/fumarate reductase flavoprotein subunit